VLWEKPSQGMLLQREVTTLIRVRREGKEKNPRMWRKHFLKTAPSKRKGRGREKGEPREKSVFLREPRKKI